MLVLSSSHGPSPLPATSTESDRRPRVTFSQLSWDSLKFSQQPREACLQGLFQ